MRGKQQFKDNLMKDLDPNQDGKLEWQEFQNGLKTILSGTISH